MENKIALVIPVYNHGTRVGDVVKKAQALDYPVIVVDDGSTDATKKSLEAISGITVLRHATNQGKGAAMITGMKTAAAFASWAITIDADGQHDPNDVKTFAAAIGSGKRSIIIGSRRRMKTAPWTSQWGKKFSNFWVRMAGTPMLSDTQSGFRAYPIPETLELDTTAMRYQYEIEVLVKAAWKGIPIMEVPVGVAYGDRLPRISHFRPFKDFMRNTKTFSRLIFHRVTTRSLWKPPGGRL